MVSSSQSSVRRSQRRVESQKSIQWGMLGAGFAAGLIVGAVLASVLRRPPPELPPPEPIAAAPPVAVLQFHKLLRETEVTVPTDQITPWQSRDRSERLLQVGAFRSWHEAELLRSRLFSQRLKPFIDSVQSDTGTWHRVQLGPFDTLLLLRTTQDKLIALELDSIVVLRVAERTDAGTVEAPLKSTP